MKRLIKLISPIVTIPLLTGSLIAGEIKTIQYNRSCSADYTEEEKGYKIFKVRCDNGYSIDNSDGDNIANRVCYSKSDNWKRCYNPNDLSESNLTFEQAGYVFKSANELISPNGDIQKAIIEKEIEEETIKLQNSLIGNQPNVDLKKIGNWEYGK